METPKRNKMNTPLSELEGSPLYNYISSLSPIQPIKPVYTPQTLNSLGFPSPSKESTFFMRHDFFDASKPTEVTSEDLNKIYSREEAPADSTHVCHDSSELQENTDQRISIRDSSVEISSEHTMLELQQTLKYNSDSPGCYPLLSTDEANSLFELSGEPAPDVAYAQDGLKEDSVVGEMYHRGVCQIEANIEGSDCDWNNFITDGSDLLVYSSPTMTQALKGLMNKQLDPSIRLSNFRTPLPQSTADDDHTMHFVNPVEDHPFEQIAVTDIGQTQDNLATVALMASDANEKMDDELVYGTHSGTWRRCLDFEMASVQRNNSDDGSTISSSTAKSDERNAEGHISKVPASMERDWESSENRVHPTKDCPQSSVCMPGENFHQNSPKRKSHEMEEEACKRCNCKKSKCVKLYCECFSAGVYCIEPCSCQDCFNKPINEDIVLKTRKQIEFRNPLAFAPKVIPETREDPTKTLASARHKRGCNCKKSSCLKKYCECYQSGVGCSIVCRCEGCKNSFGKKDAEIKVEPEKEEICEKGGRVEKASQKTEIQNIEDHPDCAFPSTPYTLFRPLLPRSFHSFVDAISGPGFFANQNALGSRSKFEKPFQTVPDDDFPITCIKTSSPNSKRISIPKIELGSSPTRRGGKKLILQSTPSFSSPNPHH